MILPPLLFAELQIQDLPRIGISFSILVLLSSSSYLINEYYDREFDVHHPLKKTRSFIAGRRSAVKIWTTALLLASIALVWGYSLGLPVFLGSIGFCVLALLYNLPPLRFKNIPYVDVLTESLNAPLRLYIGWQLVFGNTAPTSWLLIYLLLNFASMALKRYFEMRYLGRTAAVAYRAVYEHYSPASLKLLVLIPLILTFPLASANGQGLVIGATILYVLIVYRGIIKVPERLLG